MLEELAALQERQKRIDVMLDIATDTLSQISPEDFKKQLNVTALHRDEDCHITKTLAYKKGAKWPLHVHKDSDETIVMVSGSGYIEIGNNFHIVTEGQSITIPANTPHGGTALEDNTAIVCVVVPADKHTFELLGYLESIENGRQ